MASEPPGPTVPQPEMRALRTQLATFIDITDKRLETLEISQLQFQSHTEESRETNKKIEMFLSKMSTPTSSNPPGSSNSGSPATLGVATPTRVTPEGTPTNLSPSESGPSSGNKSPITNAQAIYTPIDLSDGKGLYIPTSFTFLESTIYRNPNFTMTAPISPNQIVSNPDTINHNRTLKPKINFPEFDGNNPRS
ncbi:hypothetical protein K7X08_019297 [Anisodus acutangulus]|uniref:Uncharacterized protein n=1 Tax=Anisodus acutangulus TaxID=402998 RepID=A0A9Q1RPW5_9SOLA|nr:hypothetical protein K7X08_019297 [Anisodus acutangulus]